MKFSKKIIASLLGLTVATGVMAAEKQHQEIIIEAIDNGPAEVSITQNGEQQVFIISQEALKDKELLLNELSGVSEEVQQHISQALSGLHSVGGAQLEIEYESSFDSNSDDQSFVMHKDHKKVYVVGDEKRVSYLSVDSEKDREVTFVIKDGDDLHLDSEKDAGFTAVKHLLSNLELSADQLDALQKILDSKR